MSPIVTILLYVVIPLAGFLLIAVVTLRPSGRGGTRYRSGGSWDFEPQWWMGNPGGSGVAGPPDAASTGSESSSTHTARGGARGTW